MALNPNIILSANRFDPVGAMSRGAEAAGQQNALARQTAFNQAVTQNGAAALRGDANAQNALAGFDPEMVGNLQSNALTMQSTRQQMDVRSEELAMKREEAKARTMAELETKRGQIDMAKAAQEAAKTRDLLVRAGRFQSQGDEAGYNLFLQQNGVDPREYPMAEYRYIAATMEGVLDAVDAAVGKRAETGDRFKVVGNQLIDLQADGGPQAVITAPGQEEVVFGPDGKPILSRGPVGSAAKFTEGQSKDNVYATRAAGALEKLESPVDPENPDGATVADSLNSFGENLAGRVPLVGNYFKSDAYQVAETAGDEFLQAVLRKDTGAAITEPEQALYGVTYLPRPGDGKERLAYKREARIRALEAIKSGMNAQQIEAMARADKAVVDRLPKETPTPAAPASTATPPAAGPKATDMSDEDFLKSLGLN